LYSELELRYRLRHEAILVNLAIDLEDFILELVRELPRIDRVQARAKNPERFLAKALKEENGIRKYSDPLSEIQDQIGARVITFYLNDVIVVCDHIEKYFRHIEKRSVLPESTAAFGYFGFHYIIGVPTDLQRDGWNEADIPAFFELQIKTLFQHAWSEANHDLGYKELSGSLTPDEKRRMAWASAQAWGADQIFDELHRGSDADRGRSVG
jgi:putative GTP pyrophosphokinase